MLKDRSLQRIDIRFNPWKHSRDVKEDVIVPDARIVPNVSQQPSPRKWPFVVGTKHNVGKMVLGEYQNAGRHGTQRWQYNTPVIPGTQPGTKHNAGEIVLLEYQERRLLLSIPDKPHPRHSHRAVMKLR